LTRTLGEIVTIAADRWSKTEEQRAQEISAWVRYARPIAEKIGIVPIIPLDVEIKSSLINTYKSLDSLTRAYEAGQIPRGYEFQASLVANDSLKNVQADLQTWDLLRSMQGTSCRTLDVRYGGEFGSPP